MLARFPIPGENQIERSNISMNPSADAQACPVAGSAPAAGYAERQTYEQLEVQPNG